MVEEWNRLISLSRMMISVYWDGNLMMMVVVELMNKRNMYTEIDFVNFQKVLRVCKGEVYLG